MSKTERGPEAERGFVLIAVLFLVALILIGLAVAAPQIAKSIQRDKELELVHRGEQYKRAIKLYYRKYGSYPTSIDQLMNTNQIRFLRKRYKDPMTGKDDWKLIYFGQAKVQPMGLFGQPLAGGAGIAGAGGMATPIGGSPTGTQTGTTTGGTDGTGSSSGSAFGGGSSGSAFGGGSSFGGTSSSGSGFGSSFGGTSSSGSSFGSSFGSQSATGGTTGTTGSTDPTSGSTGTAGTTGAPGTPSTGGAFGSSGSTSSTLGGGVGPIVGVEIPDTKASMKEYKKQKHYNEWEFVYNPLEDQLQGAGVTGQQNLNGAAGTGASSSGFNSVTGGATLMNGGQNGSANGSFGGSNGGTPTSGTGTTPQPQ